MLNSQQRSQLRAMANSLEPVLYIGKENVTENLIRQAEEVLEARELIKCKVQRGAGLTARQACDILCQATGADGVQAIGNCFVLFRPSQEKPRIFLK